MKKKKTVKEEETYMTFIDLEKAHDLAQKSNVANFERI